jgi:hypothetical protein
VIDISRADELVVAIANSASMPSAALTNINTVDPAAVLSWLLGHNQKQQQP